MSGIISAAILIALLIPLVVLGLSFSRIRPGYLWLLSTTGTIISLGLIVASRDQIPLSIPLAEWQSDFFSLGAPTLLIDHVSWPFAIAVLVIALSALLTDIVRVNRLDSQTWASIQALGGVGLLAVIAGNPTTMLMTWVVIDIAESVVLLIRMTGSEERERVVVAFSIRLAGIFLLMSAMLRTISLEKNLNFGDIPVEAAGYLILAAGLRLGVLPPNQPHLREPVLRRGLGTMIRFVPSAASVILLVRTGQVVISGVWQTVFIILASLSAFLGAIAWSGGKDELDGRPYFILVMGAFCLSSAALGLQDASSAWGLAMLFSGAILFLFSTHHQWLMILPGLAVFGISGLPLSPSWEGSLLFILLPWGSRFLFVVALALVLLGYIRYAREVRPISHDIERWMWLIYPVGLALLPITHYILTYTEWSSDTRGISFQTLGWWIGLIPIGIVILILFIDRRWSGILTIDNFRFNNAFNLAYRSFWTVYKIVGRFLYGITRLLEGEGSVLWALLILLILILSINLWGDYGGFEP